MTTAEHNTMMASHGAKSCLVIVDTVTGTIDGKSVGCELVDVSSNGMGADHMISLTIDGKTQDRPVTLAKGREIMTQMWTKMGA